MSEEESFETEKYSFHFYKDEHFRRTNALKAHVATVEQRNMTEDDLKELKLFFGDIGKWENLSIAIRNLLKDLGIIIREGTEPMKEFGSEKYNIEWQMNHEFALITIRLAPEERRRRTEVDRQPVELTLKEITEQVKNVPKWQVLKRTLSDLKEQV